MKSVIRTLIVEDDIITVKILTILLERYFKNIEIAGVAKNSEDFINLLVSKEPDLLLLDINLGEKKTTLEILKEIKDIRSEIIIITSNESYAIEAINNYQISGYIIKPVKTIALKNAISNAIKNIAIKSELKNKEYKLSEKLLAVTSSDIIELFALQDILYLEAQGKCTIFHFKDETTKLVSKNIGEYEKILKNNFFFRIHHKYIVNLNKVTTINTSDGSYCQLVNDKVLTIATRRQEALRKYYLL